MRGRECMFALYLEKEEEKTIYNLDRQQNESGRRLVLTGNVCVCACEQVYVYILY